MDLNIIKKLQLINKIRFFVKLDFSKTTKVNFHK